MAIGDDARLRGILEKIELLTGERSDGSRRAVLISELQGLSQDLSDQYAEIKISVRELAVEFAQSSASFKEEITVRADENSALAEIVTTLKAKINNNEAQIQDTKRALATKTMAMAEHVSSLSAQVGDARANITNIQTVYASDKLVLASDLTRIEATAGKQRTFRQASPPEDNSANNLVTGDMWFDTDDNNKIYYWSGSAWIDSSLTTIKIYRQITTPTGTHNIGDLWYDTDDNNKVWYWDGSAWDDVSDGRAGKQRTFNQATAPVNDATNKLAIGDLWFDTDDKNRVYYWGGSAWIDISDGRFALLATTASVNDEKSARVAADIAVAQRVMTTSAGTSRVYAQSYAPSSSGRLQGDIWIDTTVPSGSTSPNLTPYVWHNSQWNDNSSGTYSQYAGNAATVTQLSNSVYDPTTGLAYQWAVVGSPGLNSKNQSALVLSGGRKFSGSGYTDYSKIVLSANDIEINGSVIINGSLTYGAISEQSNARISNGRYVSGVNNPLIQIPVRKGSRIYIIATYDGDEVNDDAPAGGYLVVYIARTTPSYVSLGAIVQQPIISHLQWLNIIAGRGSYKSQCTTTQGIYPIDPNQTIDSDGMFHVSVAAYRANGTYYGATVRLMVMEFAR